MQRTHSKAEVKNSQKHMWSDSERHTKLRGRSGQPSDNTEGIGQSSGGGGGGELSKGARASVLSQTTGKQQRRGQTMQGGGHCCGLAWLMVLNATVK